MQGRKDYTEKLFLSFRLSDGVPKDNLYRRLRETLDLSFLYRDTKELYGRTGNPSIDPVVFFKLLITGYLENLSCRPGRHHLRPKTVGTLQHAYGRALFFGL